MKKFFTYVKLSIGTLVLLGLFIVLPIIAAIFGTVAIAWILSALLLVNPDEPDD
tara:strand:+ start:312 stop:473 length:162 start_codon:yes stop_codon:yes gene_type:complete